MGIRLNGIEADLRQFIQTSAGFAGIGDMVYVAPATSATSQYRSWLESQGISSGKIFTLPSLAYAAVKANRNDIVLVLPGTYTETAMLTWAKARTHMMAIGSPGWRQGGGTQITTTTAGVAATIDVTAAGVFFGGGLNISNNGANSGNLTALRISSTHFTGRQLDLWGFLNSQVASVEAASCLEFADGASYGWGCTFEDCSIGTGSGAVRTANGATTNGVIIFAVDSQSGSPSAYAEFTKCRILSRAENTATAMVKIVDGRWGVDRFVKFEDCFFHNFWLNKVNTLAQCFYFDNVTGGSGAIALKDCMAMGIDEWVAQDSGHVMANMPITGVGGGLSREPTGTVGN